MGIAKQPVPVKVFIGMMYQADFPVEPVLSRLIEKFGATDSFYGPVQFTWTDYYGDEMGQGLLKSYFTFSSLLQRDLLPGIKNWTNEIEQEHIVSGKRTINLDPGYLTRDKLVLASTKDFYHRLYLSDGIYGEVTLHYRRGCYRVFSWTYPDYQDEQFLQFLEKTRASLVYELRNLE